MGKPSFVSITITTGDVAQNVTNDEGIIFRDVNVHVYTNGVYYGDGTTMQGQISANAVVGFQGRLRAKDMFFKNLVAGNNATVVITGVIDEEIQKS